MPFYSHISSDIIQDSSSSSTSSSTCPATTCTSAIPSDLYGKLLSSTNIPTAYVSPNWARNTSAPKYQLIEIKNASMPIPDSSETNVFDAAGFGDLDGEGLGPVEGPWKTENAGSDGVQEEDDRSPNSVEVSNEVPARKKDLGPSAVGAEEDVPDDFDHGIVEESSHSGGKRSITTTDKQVAIEQLTPAPLLGTPDSSTGMERYSVKQIKDQIWIYTKNPEDLARKQWLKDIINENKDWIGLDAGTGMKKALDYAAGTGFLSWALAPHFGEIVGIDRSPEMVEEYNSLVTKAGNLECKMRAVKGDIIAEWPVHGGHRPEAPEVFEKNGFDLVALTLGIRFFYSPNLGPPTNAEHLMLNLDILLSALVENGIFLIIDFDMEDTTRFGMGSVLAALRVLQMEDIEFIPNLPYTPLQVDDPLAEEAFCYMIRARKGKNFEARQKGNGALGWQDFMQFGGFDGKIPWANPGARDKGVS